MNDTLPMRQLAFSSVIAALYCALTLALPVLSFGALQVRFSEALTLLPFFYPAAIPGLFIGCLLSNFLSPFGLLDLFSGSLATLLAAYLTSKMKRIYLAPLPPVLCNAVVVGAVLSYCAAPAEGAFYVLFPVNFASVALGELIACYALGLPFLYFLKKARRQNAAWAVQLDRYAGFVRKP